MKPEVLYNQVAEQLRQTDDISFKLLGIVPFTTLLTFVGVFIKESSITWTPWFYCLGIFGALIVFGIFRWELRNIQKCNYYGSILREFEKNTLINKLPKTERPKLLGFKIGKTEAEKFIYVILVIAWLTLPFILREVTSPSCDCHEVVFFTLYFVFAVIIMIVTLMSCFVSSKAIRCEF